MLKEPKHFKCWSNSWKYARVATSFTSFMRTWCSSPNGEEGVRRRSHQAPGGNISIGLHRLRSGAEGIQRRTRPRTLAGQLSAEGAPVRVDEQPQRRLAAAHEAGIPGYLDVLECPQEQGSPVVAKLFVGSVGGAPITILRQYIEGQNRPSAGAL